MKIQNKLKASRIVKHDHKLSRMPLQLKRASKVDSGCRRPGLFEDSLNEEVKYLFDGNFTTLWKAKETEVYANNRAEENSLENNFLKDEIITENNLNQEVKIRVLKESEVALKLSQEMQRSQNSKNREINNKIEDISFEMQNVKQDILLNSSKMNSIETKINGLDEKMIQILFATQNKLEAESKQHWSNQKFQEGKISFSNNYIFFLSGWFKKVKQSIN